MKFKSVVFAALVGLATVASLAEAQTSLGAAASGNAPSGTTTQGEVRKIDKENKKVTLKHGEIKNLEMPGMTMVFQVKEPTMLDAVKEGDVVQFKAERAGGALVITDMQVAR